MMKKSTNNYNKNSKKYEKDLDNFGSKTCIRCSSPYITEDQIKRQEFIESKSKWKSGDFKRVFGKNTTTIKTIPNIVNMSSPPRSPLSHQFREIDRNKWLKGKFRL